MQPLKAGAAGPIIVSPPSSPALPVYPPPLLVQAHAFFKGLSFQWPSLPEQEAELPVINGINGFQPGAPSVVERKEDVETGEKTTHPPPVALSSVSALLPRLALLREGRSSRLIGKDAISATCSPLEALQTLPFIPPDPVLSSSTSDDSSGGGCGVQTLRSPVLSGRRGEPRAAASGDRPAKRFLHTQPTDLLKAKGELYKTEICRNWSATGRCSYGRRSGHHHCAQQVQVRSAQTSRSLRAPHGSHDLKSRGRSETYNTKPCTDLAREGCRTCTYGRRCNYAHPGEALRRVGTGVVATASELGGGGVAGDGLYLDPVYHAALQRSYPQHSFPFGIFM